MIRKMYQLQKPEDISGVRWQLEEAEKKAEQDKAEYLELRYESAADLTELGCLLISRGYGVPRKRSYYAFDLQKAKELPKASEPAGEMIPVWKLCENTSKQEMPKMPERFREQVRLLQEEGKFLHDLSLAVCRGGAVQAMFLVSGAGDTVCLEEIYLRNMDERMQILHLFHRLLAEVKEDTRLLIRRDESEKGKAIGGLLSVEAEDYGVYRSGRALSVQKWIVPENMMVLARFYGLRDGLAEHGIASRLIVPGNGMPSMEIFSKEREIRIRLSYLLEEEAGRERYTLIAEREDAEKTETVAHAEGAELELEDTVERFLLPLLQEG